MSITYPMASVTKPDNLRFTFKGTRSDAMGLKVLTIPTRTGPAERLSSQTIPGRSGSLTLSEGVDIFDDISIATNVFLEHPSVEQLDALSVWYRGQGELNFNYNPWYQQAGYFIATCAAQPAFSPIVKDAMNLLWDSSGHANRITILRVDDPAVVGLALILLQQKPQLLIPVTLHQLLLFAFVQTVLAED